MVRRLSSLWCWRCDGEMPHQAHARGASVEMVCELCGAAWTLCRDRRRDGAEPAEVREAATRRE